MGRGNPAFLLDYLSGLLYLDCFANPPPMGWARNDMENFWKPL